MKEKKRTGDSKKRKGRAGVSNGNKNSSDSDRI
jgi:hypothetical protein